MTQNFLLLLSTLPTLLLGFLAFKARSFESNQAAWKAFTKGLYAALGIVAFQALVYGTYHLLADDPAFNSHEGWLTHWFGMSAFGLWMSVLVQLLGLVIGVFSSRYLNGEPKQKYFIAVYSGVLASVHLLLIANHWVILIAAWAAIGLILRRLLRFYDTRPFALLAAFKKTIADRLADVFLLLAAGLAWAEVGSGSLSQLFTYISEQGLSQPLHFSAVFMVVAVILRTALFPVHGWLIQVMEAPTPVSALLHAGVVNLGGFVLITFAPLLNEAFVARWLLVLFGLVTAILAGLVMLTRVSIKVRLAWSTVAQMGFMILECGLGLYTLAALHLVGHSLYKAHTFLSASSVVQQSKISAMRGSSSTDGFSLLIAPVVAFTLVYGLQTFVTTLPWPAWWGLLLAFAWAPLLWLPKAMGRANRLTGQRLLFGVGSVLGLTLLALLAHWLPFGLTDSPLDYAGWLALAGMVYLYVALALMQALPQRLSAWRRWAYAGFYVDEFFTRLALTIWPAVWNVRQFQVVQGASTLDQKTPKPSSDQGGASS